MVPTASLIPSPQHSVDHSPAALTATGPFFNPLFFFARCSTEHHKNPQNQHKKPILFSHCIGKTEGLNNWLLQLQVSSLPLKQAADPETYRLLLFQSP